MRCVNTTTFIVYDLQVCYTNYFTQSITLRFVCMQCPTQCITNLFILGIISNIHIHVLNFYFVCYWQVIRPCPGKVLITLPRLIFTPQVINYKPSRKVGSRLHPSRDTCLGCACVRHVDMLSIKVYLYHTALVQFWCIRIARYKQ